MAIAASDVTLGPPPLTVPHAAPARRARAQAGGSTARDPPSRARAPAGTHIARAPGVTLVPGAANAPDARRPTPGERRARYRAV
ncbi:hypothetical protein NW94_10230 [Burkholderia mallei]|nr:conserved hypothetical protein [Burkholderia mallei SAVP1]ATD89265.1 hypothetical protein NM78_09905 [Burkholderia mallei]EES42985.1 conserved hypothetical protein [Burkholderia mallei PRL-20]ATD94021.1 hypothetical protein NW91_09905 [Burkholderia mallei]ATD98834.1 hypothetical protein NW92_10315 [Burkholderia mallei]